MAVGAISIRVDGACTLRMKKMSYKETNVVYPFSAVWEHVRT